MSPKTEVSSMASATEQIAPQAVGRVERLRKIIDPIIFAILILLGWELMIWVFKFHPVVLPPPSRVWTILSTQGDFLAENMLVSLKTIVKGFAYGTFLGWLAGIFITYSRTVRKAFQPLLVVLFVVPKSIMLPLVILWWGVGSDFPNHKIVITMLLAFFPVTENTIAGLSGVDREMVELTHSLGGSAFLTIRKIALPFSLPFVLAGLRIAMTESFIGTLFCEVLVPTDGIGSRIVDAQDTSNTHFIIAAIMVIAIFGLAAYFLMNRIERRLTRWY